MPLPATLEKIVTTLADKFDPAKARPEYNEQKSDWELYLDLFEMDQKKLQKLLDKHTDTEESARYQLRQKLSSVFNYVPTLIRMVVNYLHWDEPTIDVGSDAELQAFLRDADGSGMPLHQHTRQVTLPLALLYGFIDTLVQNPAVEPGEIRSVADQQAAGLRPQVYTIRPLQRINWSTKPSHEYNWIRFVDYDNENNNPFRQVEENDLPASYLMISGRVESIIELAGAEDTKGGGFWMRSWQGLKDSDGKAKEPDAFGLLPEGKKEWIHDGDWLPVSFVPIQTLYYSRSNDPTKRHFGLSKIAMVAILTKKIIQVLSWTDEDVLANLAIFCLPGKRPIDPATQKPIDIAMNPQTILWMGAEAKIPPAMLQGDTEHISIKLRIIDIYIREILRLAYLIGASAEAEQITSGVQGVVARNELFMELSDMAGALDTYTRGVLSMVKAHIDNAPVDPTKFKVKVNYYKGPYIVDPLETTIKNTKELIAVFSRISPEMVKQVYRQLALSVMFNEDETRVTVLKEIDKNFAAVLAEMEAQRTAIEASLANPGEGVEPGEESGVESPANPLQG